MNSLVKNTTLRFSRRRADQASYEPLDQTHAAVGEDNYRKNFTTSRRKVTSVDNETKGFSYKRDRAKKRLIYLQSYNLGSGDASSRKMLKSRKLKKAAVRVKSVAVSVVSFIRISSITALQRVLHLFAGNNMVHHSHPTMNRPPPAYATVHPDENVRIPLYQQYKRPPYGRPRRSNCCLRCICCCYCFLFILIIILAGLSLYFYTILKPQVPSYKVTSVHVKNFEPLPDLSLKSEFIVYVEANNPNSHISLIYGEGSNVTLWYRGLDLSHGKLPAFRQGTNNITMMHIDMNGKSKLEAGTQEALSQDQKNKMVPMIVQVRAPITVVVGKFKVRQFVVYVNCSLALDSLSPNKNPEIISTTYMIDASL